MAKITIVLDEDDDTISASIDGKDLGNVTYLSASRHSDYYKPNKMCLCWSINVENDTGSDDIRSYTSYTSAGVNGEPTKGIVTSSAKVRSDLEDYLAGTKRRRK